MKRISVDIGGTFTDCFFVWDDIYVEAASEPSSTAARSCPKSTRCATPPLWAPTR
jgi:N-methylhydantoinase A/oxoprolinase/acetone carboxylase beta subunit